jgi:ABC-type glycerol-3-phosphate transport system permease component
VVAEEKKYPLGLTKEQYEAVIVAVLVALVFYPEVQAKLAIYIPNFMSRDGSRSMAGLAVSGLIVAIGFYLARRYFVDK